MNGYVITPYCKEPRAIIDRCIASVAAQTVPVTHMLIADGYPVELPQDIMHVAITGPNEDYGDTPRAVGMRIAAESKPPFIALLDVDNTYDPDHIAHCLEVAARAPCGYVAAKRRFVQASDFVALPYADESAEEHCDTSCMFYLPSAYKLAMTTWHDNKRYGRSKYGDRAVYSALKSTKLRRAFADRKTVNYSLDLTDSKFRIIP